MNLKRCVQFFCREFNWYVRDARWVTFRSPDLYAVLFRVSAWEQFASFMEPFPSTLHQAFCRFCCKSLPTRYPEHVQDWRMVTAAAVVDWRQSVWSARAHFPRRKTTHRVVNHWASERTDCSRWVRHRNGPHTIQHARGLAYSSAGCMRCIRGDVVAARAPGAIWWST